MTHRFAPAGALVLSSAAFGLALTALSAIAQPSQGSPPATDITNRVRGVAQPQAPTTEDKLPTSHLKLPQGFKVETYIHGIMDARSLRLGDKGTLFVGNRVRDKVYAVVSQGNKREAKVIASGLDRPNGLAFKDGTLYIAEGTKISKLEKIEDNLDSPPKPVVIYSDFADHRSHGWKFLTIGPDNKLYVSVGAPCNVCEPSERHAVIQRMKADGSGLETVARGVRNSVGFDWSPVDKALWFTDNGRDMLGDDLPSDELNRVTRAGQHFGFPYCHQGDTADPEYGARRPCSEFVAPAANLGAHVAAIGMRFYTGTQFPAAYRGNIFIAEHGSWNRSSKVGYRIARVTVDAQGRAGKPETFVDGWLQGESAWGRPADVLVLPDGSLLVSDDHAGAIYRIRYAS